MKIAILGAGNVGCTMAADLSIKGHEVTLIKTTESMHNENFNYLQEKKGKIILEENNQKVPAHIHHLTTDLADIAPAELIFIFIQTNYHEDLIQRLKPHLHDGQTLIFNPGYLSTAYVLKHIEQTNISVVEAESSFIDCRISELGVAKVSFRNVQNPIAVYPASHQAEVRKKFDQLHYPITYLKSVVEVALHNPNLIVHTIGAIMSIPRIEKTAGDYVMYHEVFTPSVWNILERLDAEKMDVLEKLDFERLSYVEACKIRNTLDDSRDAKEVFFWYANKPTVVRGPHEVDSRFMTEDVPEGLVLLETLASELDIPTPVCTSLIEIAQAALNTDFRTVGRTIERLGLENVKKLINA